MRHTRCARVHQIEMYRRAWGRARPKIWPMAVQVWSSTAQNWPRHPQFGRLRPIFSSTKHGIHPNYGGLRPRLGRSNPAQPLSNLAIFGRVPTKFRSKWASHGSSRLTRNRSILHQHRPKLAILSQRGPNLVGRRQFRSKLAQHWPASVQMLPNSRHVSRPQPSGIVPRHVFGEGSHWR